MSKIHLYALGADGDLPAGAFQPYAPGRMRLHGGGGSSGAKNYKNLEVLYGEQAASARLLREQAEKNLPGMVDAYVDRSKQFLDPGYAERQAGQAASDMASANAMERAATERNLASMGVNPNDPRFAGSMRATETSNAARMAAGQNIARNDALKLQHAVAQDAVGTFTGQSNSAAAQMGSASSGMANLASMQQQAQMNKDAQRQNAVAATVGGGMAMWNALKDGGRVGVPRGIRTLERHFGGGPAGSQQGFFPSYTQFAPPPAQAQAPQRSPIASAMEISSGANTLLGASKKGTLTERMAARGAENMDKFGRLTSFVNEGAGRNLSSHAAGMRMTGEQTQAAAKAYEAAAANAADPAAAKQYLDVAANMRAGAGLEGVASTGAAVGEAAGAAGAAAGEALAATGAEALAGQVAGQAAGGAAAGAAGTAAGAGAAASGVAGTAAASGATTAAASGAASALGAVSAALPWVGAAAAVGSLLGLFADGGEVDVQDYRAGGDVAGPGSHTDDVIPALLSNGEGVLNGEAMALGGDEIMEKLNREGLKLRRRGIDPDRIRGLGLKLNLQEAAA